jgi:hypothetical protein
MSFHGFGFRVSGFGFRVSGFEFRVMFKVGAYGWNSRLVLQQNPLHWLPSAPSASHTGPLIPTPHPLSPEPRPLKPKPEPPIAIQGLRMAPMRAWEAGTKSLLLRR